MCFQWGLECEGGPNISGSLQWAFATSDKAAGGCFSVPMAEQNNLAGSDDAYVEEIIKLAFDASDSSSVYGRASTVQPSALRSLLCIKI